MAGIKTMLKHSPGAKAIMGMLGGDDGNEDEVPEAKKRVERPQSMRKKPRVKTNMIT